MPSITVIVRVGETVYTLGLDFVIVWKWPLATTNCW
jgi:hypothetical protein